VKSSSDYSCHSYESFVGQASGQDDNNKEKISIRSEGLDSVSEHRRVPTNLSKIRKVSAVSVLIFESD
jgi:voltage-gated sodium channel type II alpha